MQMQVVLADTCPPLRKEAIPMPLRLPDSRSTELAPFADPKWRPIDAQCRKGEHLLSPPCRLARPSEEYVFGGPKGWAEKAGSSLVPGLDCVTQTEIALLGASWIRPFRFQHVHQDCCPVIGF